MLNPPALRKAYGPGTFLYIVDAENFAIPWRALTIDEFLFYDRAIRDAKYSRPYLEDEIFLKCVLEPTVIQNIDTLDASVVTNTANAILLNSGPATPEDIQNGLNYGRFLARGIITDIMNLIVQAYPAYTIEALEEMTYEKLMTRVAQAEKKLLETGVLKESLSFTARGGPVPQGQAQAKTAEEKSKPFDDWHAAELEKAKARSSMANGPVPEGETVVIKANQMQAKPGDDEFTAMSQADRMVENRKLKDDAAIFYKDYFEQARRGEKIEIKTEEERRREAEDRLEENRKIFEKTDATMKARQRKAGAKIQEKLANATVKRKRKK